MRRRRGLCREHPFLVDAFPESNSPFNLTPRSDKSDSSTKPKSILKSGSPRTYLSIQKLSREFLGLPDFRIDFGLVELSDLSDLGVRLNGELDSGKASTKTNRPDFPISSKIWRKSELRKLSTCP